MRFAFLAYRRWAYDVISRLIDTFPFKERYDISCIITPDNGIPEADFSRLAPVRKIRPLPSNPKHFEGIDADYFVLLGWSWMIDKESTSRFRMIGMHPSPLPRYRGGTPIQYQIIAGEEESAATIFDISTELDNGPVYASVPFSLKGELSDVLASMAAASLAALNLVLPKLPDIKPVPQDESKATTNWLRRTPEDSHLTLEDFETAKTAYDKVRALQDPYPNAFIVCKDGTKLYVTRAHL